MDMIVINFLGSSFKQVIQCIQYPFLTNIKCVMTFCSNNAMTGPRNNQHENSANHNIY